MRRSWLLSFALVLLATSVDAASTIERAAFGSGGGVATATTHIATVLAGQSIAGGATSFSHAVGSGFWAAIPVATDVETERQPNVPARLLLHQSVPNPFNPVTTIAFDVPTGSGVVRLRVHSVDGELVRTLVNGPFPAGFGRIVWRGTNDAGQPVASGVYFYVLEANGQRLSRRTVLLR